MKEKSFLIGIVFGIILISGFIYFFLKNLYQVNFPKLRQQFIISKIAIAVKNILVI